ncbi:MAG: HNH endonuclease [bacterium]|nr:HNH endonuclease [bacterium]MCM1375981.1 HNH endonuclease [Muribaculum sp.]
MTYIRKRHWVTYNSEKCKMYLRNDFNFECAYCGMQEKDNVVGEQLFEKDHFVSRKSDVEWNVDCYDNLVYSCCKCNRTKSDQNIEMILNPCKDDIYEGEHPHILRLGAENYYKLQGVTLQGKQFIDYLKLNSRYYRKIRQIQAQNEEIRKTIYKVLNESSDLRFSEIDWQIKAYLENGTLIKEKSDEFRCGTSKAGEDLYAVLEKLKEKGIKYKLLFADDDLDLRVEYCGSTYYCEIRVTDYAGMKRRGPIVEREKKAEWLKTGNACGVLYFYKEQDIIYLYIYPDEERTEIVKLE